METADRLKKQFEFLLEADKEKNIFRQTYLADGSRRENDAEHSWHMALMVLLMSEYSNEPIDVLHTMSMALVHDLVEIYAGDTYAYDSEAHRTKKARETEAADRLFGMLPGDQAEKFRNLWNEYEECVTPEAKFTRVADRIQPLMLNDASKGKSWEEHGVKASMVYERNHDTGEGSETLWNYAEKNFIEPNVKSGKLKSF